MEAVSSKANHSGEELRKRSHQSTGSSSTADEAQGSRLGCPRTEKEVAVLKEHLKGMGQYQTMDLELRSGPLLQAVRSRQPRQWYRGALVWRWMILLATGGIIGIISFFFSWAVRSLWLGLYRSTEHMIRTYPESFWRGYLVYLFVTVGYGLLASVPVVAIGRGGLINGGGISEMKAYFHGVYFKHLLNFWPTLARLWSGVFINGANLIGVGEAPLVHVGAAVAEWLANALQRPWVRRILTLNGLLFAEGLRALASRFDTEEEQQHVVARGGSAGYTSAFATPVAGMLFPAEEGGQAFEPARMFTSLVSNCVAMWMLMAGVMLFKQRGSFWDYKLFDLTQSANTNIVGGLFYCYIWEIPVFILIGVLAGVAGAAFVQVSVRLRHLRKRFMPWGSPRQWLRTCEVALIAAVTASVWFLVIWKSPCAPAPSPEDAKLLKPQSIPSSLLQLASPVEEPFPRLYCPVGQYSVYGSIFWQPLQSMMRILIHTTEGTAGNSPLPPRLQDFAQLDARALAIFMCVQFVLVTWTYGSAMAVGAFTPALAIGAAMGQLIAHGANSIRNLAYSNSNVSIAYSTYAIVGAAAMLSGFVRYKATAVIMVAEMTGAITLVPVIALGVGVAAVVGDRLSPGIYDAYLRDKDAPMLQDPKVSVGAALIADRLTAADVMISPVTTLPPVCSIGHIVDILQEQCVQSYPLAESVAADGSFEVAGVISLKALLLLLHHRNLLRQQHQDAERGSGNWHSASLLDELTVQEQEDLLVKIRPYSASAHVDKDKYIGGISNEEREWFLDLRPFAYHSPLVFDCGASCLHLQHVFRHLGCHEVLVTNRPQHACGFISKKDMTEANGQLQLDRLHQRGRKASKYHA